MNPWETKEGWTDTDGFLAAYAKDDNTFWRMDSGHAQNVIDTLIDRLEESEAVTKRNERDRIMAVIIQYWINWTNDDRCTEDYCTECTIFMNILRRIDEKEATQG